MTTARALHYNYDMPDHMFIYPFGQSCYMLHGHPVTQWSAW